ncbi:hypothetical protein H257_12101 [Aphanomyces astaci]|uniref:Uncharacterized protein n=1 Tax=Aphanomyces astaci TaxID=112090 RepID=W4G064_APHAT|nr:hypothetical protein H257_12101 [Aphanomyces astaci]ETV73065.1 hypothetical protein H257_12101 [Aphanomyces astaci]|eukprot:XP_009837514.1 hypothetical protein H257_12101 [Aphanomyces astaci]
MSDYQTADSYLYDQATSSDHTPSVSSAKRMTYVTDRNQGSYGAGVIEIDAQSQLMGSKGFASLRDSYITLPYVVTLQNNGDVGATAMGGIVEMDGKTILTDGDYKLFWNNIRAQTEWSESDRAKHVLMEVCLVMVLLTTSRMKMLLVVCNRLKLSWEKTMDL